MGEGAARWPASVFQRSVVQLEGIMPGALSRPTETLGITVRVRGPLDVDLLDRAYAELVGRHELLRSRLVRVAADGTTTGAFDGPALEGELWQEVRPTATPGELGAPCLDRLAPGDERPVAGGPTWPIEVDEPPLVRGAIVQVDEREHHLGLTLHHVVSDLSSPALAMRDLALVYTARLRGGEPPPIPLQHGAYAVWQRKRLAEREGHDQQAWARSLAGLTPPRYRRSIPFEEGRAAEAATVKAPLLDGEECDALAEWSRRHGSPVFATLLAAFARTLADTTDARDLPVTSAFELRDNPAIRNLPGPFLYPTLLRIGVTDGEPPRELVARVRDGVTAAYSRAQVTLMDLAAHAPALLPGVLGLEPSWLRLFQYQPSDKVQSTFRFGDALGRAVVGESRTAHSLAYGAHLHAWHDAGGALVGRLGYDRHDLDQPAARALLTDWATTVRSFIAS
jgi:hypothetical protein